ncbi:hypothetical protein ABZ412_23540 [Nocardia sp. NPDC005746]|uniref:hypothetical protein n=1 Tax=Nocardia sp. NPDC005746 TaxID=3157062 RepID=UPI0033DFF901
MKSALAHRVSTVLATAVASAALATGAATAAPLTLDPVAASTNPAPIAGGSPTGSAGLDLGNAILGTVLDKLATGSALVSGSAQWACKGQNGTWIPGDSTHDSRCEYPVFHPSSLMVDTAADPVAAATDSGSSGSSSSGSSALGDLLGPWICGGSWDPARHGCYPKVGDTN